MMHANPEMFLDVVEPNQSQSLPPAPGAETGRGAPTPSPALSKYYTLTRGQKRPTHTHTVFQWSHWLLESPTLSPSTPSRPHPTLRPFLEELWKYAGRRDVWVDWSEHSWALQTAQPPPTRQKHLYSATTAAAVYSARKQTWVWCVEISFICTPKTSTQCVCAFKLPLYLGKCLLCGPVCEVIQ